MFSTHTYISLDCLFYRTQKNKMQKKPRKVSKTIDRKRIKNNQKWFCVKQLSDPCSEGFDISIISL